MRSGRIILWTGGVLLALAVLVVLAFRLSPWPSVALIQYMFSRGDAQVQSALERHVPPGIATRADIAYGPGASDRLDLFHGEAAGPQPTVIWVHGGAWIAGDKSGVSNYLRVLAGQGYTTIALEYATGYGSTYPEPVRQVNAALAHIVAHATELNVDPERIVLGGDSAGAQIAAQVALLTQDEDYAARLGIDSAIAPGTIKGTLLLSGAYDLERIDLDGDYGWFLRTVLWAYTGVRDVMADSIFRLASVAEQVTARFPPTFISSGNGDPLEPQAVRMAARLAELDVPVAALFFPAALEPPLPHEYQFDLDRPEGRQAFGAMVDFLDMTVPRKR